MAKKRKRTKQKEQTSKSTSKQDSNKLYAFLASFFTIIGFIIAIILWKDNKYIMFYAKQGLVLFIAQVIIAVLTPFLNFLIPILWILFVILWICVWINALSGKKKRTIIITDLAEKIKL